MIDEFRILKGKNREVIIMKLPVDFDTDSPVYVPSSDNLVKITSELIMGYNGWKRVEKLIEEIPLLKNMYENTMEDMLRNGNCGMVSCLCSTIKEAFRELRDFKENE